MNGNSYCIIIDKFTELREEEEEFFTFAKINALFVVKVAKNLILILLSLILNSI